MDGIAGLIGVGFSPLCEAADKEKKRKVTQCVKELQERNMTPLAAVHYVFDQIKKGKSIYNLKRQSLSTPLFAKVILNAYFTSINGHRDYASKIDAAQEELENRIQSYSWRD